MVDIIVNGVADWPPIVDVADVASSVTLLFLHMLNMLFSLLFHLLTSYLLCFMNMHFTWTIHFRFNMQ